MSKQKQIASLMFAALSAKERAEIIREQTGAPEPIKPDGIIATKNIARRLDRTVRTVQNLFDSGALTRVFLPGRKRCCGCRESELTALIAGTGVEGGGK
jgi:hypothetical protein